MPGFVYHLLSWKIMKCYCFITIVSFMGFQCCKKLSGNWTVLLFWGFNRFHKLNGFLNTENVKILPYKTPKNKQNAFWDISGCCKGIICLQIPTKLNLAVILKGQPSFTTSVLRDVGFVTFCPTRTISDQPSMTQNMAAVFLDSLRVIWSVSEEKMNLHGNAHGR